MQETVHTQNGKHIQVHVCHLQVSMYRKGVVGNEFMFAYDNRASWNCNKSPFSLCG